MQFEVEGPEFASSGDEVEIGDDICCGDLVWFDRIASNKVVMRLIAGPAREYACYRVERGSAPSVIKLVFQEPGQGQVDDRGT
jgi:hypothetical protein